MIRLPVLQSTLQCCKYSRSSLLRLQGNLHISTASRPVETTAAAHHRNSLRGSSSRHIRTMIMASNKPASGAGQAMFALNQWTQGKREPWVKMVKGCVDLAVQDVFAGGHAQCQLQGSMAKGTAVKGISDCDFFIKLDSTTPFVTQRQRQKLEKAIKHHLQGACVSFETRFGENRIHMTQGMFQDGRGTARVTPDVDIVFERYKHSVKKPPSSSNDKPSHTGQKAVQYIKSMPQIFTNLPGPTKSMYVEDVVMICEKRLCKEQQLKKGGLTGSKGFETLMTSLLQSIARCGCTAPGSSMPNDSFCLKLQEAGMHCRQWEEAAAKVLRLRRISGSWPMPPNITGST